MNVNKALDKMLISFNDFFLVDTVDILAIFANKLFTVTFDLFYKKYRLIHKFTGPTTTTTKLFTYIYISYKRRLSTNAYYLSKKQFIKWSSNSPKSSFQQNYFTNTRRNIIRG